MNRFLNLILRLSPVLAILPCSAEPEPAVVPKVNRFEIQAPGNLAGSVPFTGSSLAEIKPAHTPPDLGKRALELFASDRRASLDLVTAAQLLAYFDQARVADPSAHVGWDALVQQTGLQTIISWGAFHPDEYQKSIHDTVAWAEKTAPPAYQPRWMIQHGLGAFGAAAPGNGLVPDFDAEASWRAEAEKLAAFAQDEDLWNSHREKVTPEGAKAFLGHIADYSKNALAQSPVFSEEEQEKVALRLDAMVHQFDPSKGDIGTQVFDITEAINTYLTEVITAALSKKGN